VIAHEMLTGTLPFGGVVASSLDVLDLANLPIPARNFFAHALAVDPLRRSCSARALRSELAGAIAASGTAFSAAGVEAR
jgi:hypothetical protein